MLEKNNKIYDSCNVGLRGLIPSLHTPFKYDGKIDEKSLKRLVDHIIQLGCSGMLIGAVAGEGPSLTIDERKRLFTIVTEQNSGAIPLIGGCSSDNQKTRIELAEIAKRCGIDWALCQIPKIQNEKVLISTMTEIANAGPPNLMIQDLSWNDEGLEIELIDKLFNQIDSFKSLKIEVRNSGQKYTKVLKKTKGKLHVSGGWAITEMIEALERGVHALMPSTLEEIFLLIIDYYNSGKKRDAEKLFKKIRPILIFTHQDINVSIYFSKMLRVREDLFETSFSRISENPSQHLKDGEIELYLSQAVSIKQSINKI